MVITPENLVRHELIGLKVKVIKSTDKSRENVKGRIVNETKKTLRIDTGKKEITVPKGECVFMIEIPGKKVEVNGKLLVGRPEDRIKKKLPQKWCKNTFLGGL